MRLHITSIAGALIIAAASATGAAAMTATPLLDTGDGAQVIQVRGGCGFGEHRGPFLGCRINHGPRGRIRAATTGLPRGCPPGERRGFYGRCRF